ncbi:CDP-glycerol glycerophosphotransferase family protein [Jatrophihabitans sp.]|uniref:CDP-glycerol glycerophosphotransferase family protein n=1 Tax=Jatrophihabitans sp. TaxID=1932789 RepID=UPI0030C7030D|nr:CDP-Glycerol:Poly(Glycerophosphate) glycerophosphotransferase [Jatrophihabitans sp.]
MARPAPTFDVVVTSRWSDADQIAATVEALRKLPAGQLRRVSVTAGVLTAAQLEALGPVAGQPVTLTALSDAGTVEESDSDYVLFLRGGDLPTRAALNEIVIDCGKGIALSVYVLRPEGKYILDAGIATKPFVAIERDVTSTWVGESGFAVSRAVLHGCHVYDLRTGMGLSGLFLESLLHAGRFRSTGRTVRCGAKLEDALTIEPWLYDAEWYHGLNTFFLSLFAVADERFGAVPVYLQHAYLYLLQWRIKYNRNTGDKQALRGDTDRFFGEVGAVLGYIADEVVLYSSGVRNLDVYNRIFHLGLKGSAGRLAHRYYDSEIALVLDSRPVLTASGTGLTIEAMQLAGDTLTITGRYQYPIDASTMSLVADYEATSYPLTITERYTESRALGRRLYSVTSFSVAIPLRRKVSGSINFSLRTTDGRTVVALNPRFTRPMARLTDDKLAYWRSGRYTFYYRAGRIVVTPTTRNRLRTLELDFVRSLRARKTADTSTAARTRVAYFLTRFYFRKRTVWVYFDKLYKAGDNGEYAYKYAARERDGVSKYYVLRDDVPDARRLKREGVRILRYGTLWHRLVFLNADIVFTTHINPQNFGGFAGGIERHFRGLYHYQLICIQHGLSVQELAGTLNQVFDNTSYFCLASPVEVENLSRPEYGYRPEQLELTGLARYDGLTSDDQRTILIAPTWRNYLAAPYSMGRSRSYSTAFRDSDYFRLYDSLIHDPRLLAKARATGYRITLLLHPVTSSQADDFQGNDCVEIRPATGELNFERTLSEASLMVTDYSGLQFDFAYMYKPVVYFHPPSLPPSYDEGTYKYESMALGEIHTEVDGLVAALCDYMDAECKLKDEYRLRIDDFFAFHDKSSAARIYALGRRVQGLPPVTGTPPATPAVS